MVQHRRNLWVVAIREGPGRILGVGFSSGGWGADYTRTLDVGPRLDLVDWGEGLDTDGQGDSQKQQVGVLTGCRRDLWVVVGRGILVVTSFVLS